MNKKELKKHVKECLEKSTDRNFKQSVDLYVNFENVDMRQTDNKINLNILLPKGRGKDVDVGVFADGDMKVRAKKVSDYVLDKSELEEMSKDKKKMRKFAKSCYSFIAQADLMPTIGKKWGVALGPRGKMPQPVPPSADLKPVVERLKNTIRIISRKNPTVNAPVGTEGMKAEDLADNIMTVMEEIERQIPRENIASAYIKTTMGKPVEII